MPKETNPALDDQFEALKQQYEVVAARAQELEDMLEEFKEKFTTELNKNTQQGVEIRRLKRRTTQLEDTLASERLQLSIAQERLNGRQAGLMDSVAPQALSELAKLPPPPVAKGEDVSKSPAKSSKIRRRVKNV